MKGATPSKNKLTHIFSLFFICFLILNGKNTPTDERECFVLRLGGSRAEPIFRQEP